MGRKILGELIGNTKLGNSKSDEILDLIKRNAVLNAATKGNNALLLALVEAARAMAGVEKLTDKMVTSLIKSEPNLTQAAKSKAFLQEFVKFLEAVIKGKLAGTPPKTQPSQPTPNTPTDEPNEEEPIEDEIEESEFDINLKVMALLNDIPIAHPGDIITSEHHNSLRRAIRAIANLIGDVDSTSIHTFGPMFLPTSFPNPEDNSNLSWKLLYHKAVVPSVQEMGGAGGIVKGGLLVRLPDDVLIKSMIVRGKRLDEEAQDPKSFDVTLVRVEPDKTGTPSQTIINTDLKDANGTFKRAEKPTSSVRVDNTKYQYYVTAVWADEDDSSGFEIRSVQIICER